MATFSFNNITYTIYYVDTTGAAGTGSSLADSANSFPTFSSIAANTCVVIRRTSTIVLAGALTNANANIMIIGAPKYGDVLYSFIPDIASWEGDGPDKATIYIGNGAHGIEFTGINPYIERLTLSQAYAVTSHSGNKGIVVFSNASGNGIIKSCLINLSGGANYANESSVPVTRYGIALVGANSSIDSCEVDMANTAVTYITDASNMSMTNTVLKSFKERAFYIGGSILTTGRIAGCSMYNKGDLPTCQLAGSGGFVGEISNSLFYNNNIRNYGAFSLDNAATIVNVINCTFSGNFNSTNSASVYLVFAAGNFNFKNCTFSSDSENSSSFTGVPYTVAAGTHNFFNCTFNYPGLIGSPSASTGNNIFSGCTFTRSTPCIDSPLYIPTVDPAKHYRQLSSFGNAVLYVGTLSLASTAIAQRNIIMGTSGKIFIDNLDVSLGTGSSYSYLNFSSSEEAAIYVKNENGVAGNWNARSFKTYMNTSNTYRSTSSKTYSIKSQSFSAASTARKPYLWLAPSPFQGIPVNFGTTGKKKITLYIAYKLYDPSNPVDLNDLVLEIDVPAAVSGSTRKMITSQCNGIILDDSSTWNNDSGLTTKKIEVIFDMLQTGDTYCRIGYFKYQAGYTAGYLVFDTGLIGSNA